MYMAVASSRADRVLALPLLRQPNLHMRTLNTCESRSHTYISKLASNPSFPLAPNPERKWMLNKIPNGNSGFKSISKQVSRATSENSSPQSSSNFTEKRQRQHSVRIVSHFSSVHDSHPFMWQNPCSLQQRGQPTHLHFRLTHAHSC